MFAFAIGLTPWWDLGGIGVRVEIVYVYSYLLRFWPDQMGHLVAVVCNVLALKGGGGFAIYRFRPRFDPASRDNWNAFVMVAQAPEPIFSTGLVASFAARHAVVDLVATAVQHIGRTDRKIAV